MKRNYDEMNKESKIESFRNDNKLKLQKMDTIICDICSTEASKENIFGPFAFCSRDCFEMLVLIYYTDKSSFNSHS
jgi:hypothetical protein